MTSRDSGENSTIVNLQASQTFTGRVVEAGGFTKCGVSVLCDRPIRLQIYQSISGSIVDKVDVYEIEASTIPEPHTEFAPKRRAVELNYRYFYITARNTGETASTTCRIQTQLYNDGFLDHAHDRVALWGQDENAVQHAVYTDASGALAVGVIGTVSIPPITGTVEVSNFPAYQPSIEVSNFPAIQTVDGEITLDHTKTGVNADFAFYPSASNISATIYADGALPISQTGGWRYTNNPTAPTASLKKINWYIYQSALSDTDYKVSQVESMYAVVNNLSTLGLGVAQNPFIIFYTRPTGVGDAQSWYKSKYFFGSNAFTGDNGYKLLYTGADPVGIHPEITGINRIQLDFNLGLSTKTLEAGADESITTSSLQTSSVAVQAGEFDFVLNEYGVVWEKTEVLLPVEFGKLQIGGSVVVSSAPHLSYLTDNIAVATMPAITGSVSVTSQPHLSYLTDNIAVATQPALAFATDKVDATGSTVITSHTTSSVVAWDNPTSLVSFDSGSSVRNIKTSAGSLHSLSITNDNNALTYVALYNELAINVTAGTTTPVAVFTINKNQQIQLPLHAVQFSTAISFFSATAYGGGIAQTAVYLTASYNG